MTCSPMMLNQLKQLGQTQLDLATQEDLSQLAKLMLATPQPTKKLKASPGPNLPVVMDLPPPWRVTSRDLVQRPQLQIA